MTVADALVQFRELKCLPTRFKEMTVRDIISNRKEMQALYNALRNGMRT